MVNYSSVRNLAKAISVLSRYESIKGNTPKAVKVLLSNISLIRQYMSYCNETNGMTLIDAMVCIAMVNCLKYTVNSTNGFNGYDGTVFPVLKERWEALDNIFPLTGPAIQSERLKIEKYYEKLNMIVARKAGPGYVALDKEWMTQKLDHYFPSPELFTKPYMQIKPQLEIYSQRIGEMETIPTSPVFYLNGIISRFRPIFHVLLAISLPNYNSAYKTEFTARSDLRGYYLSFAISFYKKQQGALPEKLADLAGYVKSDMLTDPYTGEFYFYERSGEKAQLTTLRNGETITFFDY